MSQVKIYHASRARAALGALLFSALASLAVLLPDHKPLVAWGLALLFGGAAGMFLVNAVAGATLTLGRKGFEIASVFQRKRVRWNEIEVLHVGELRRTKMIAVNYLPHTGKQSVGRGMTGADLSIGTQYKVPLEELCEAMNDHRDRFLAAQGTARPTDPGRDSAPAEAGAAVPDGLPARTVLVAFCAALFVLGLNVLLRVVLKLQGMYVTLGIAFGTAALVMAWFLRVVGRAPTTRERNRFLWIYTALVVVPWLGVFLATMASRGFNGWALMLLALHAIAYPAAAQMFLTQKKFGTPRRASGEGRPA
ncbi:MAG TPA: hypothetical protein VGD76_19440 [Ramlibacter sp.]